VCASHTSLVGGKERGGETVQPQRPPSLEQLEPRVLLSADLGGIEPAIDYGVLADEQAIIIHHRSGRRTGRSPPESASEYHSGFDGGVPTHRIHWKGVQAFRNAVCEVKW